MARAFWISFYREIRDPAKLAAYAQLAVPAITAGGGEFLARAVAAQAYEAGLKSRVTLIAFDSIEDAIATHESDAYRAAVQALDGGATRDIRLVEALSAGSPQRPRSTSQQDTNKALVRASFDRWVHGTGSPFELLLPETNWTIVGSSPLSKTYHGTQSFLDEVIHPFNARMRTPLVPAVRGIYADGDTVITLFDGTATAVDGVPYRNTYTWYFTMRDGKVTQAIAFFDTRELDELWRRVNPS